jgi:hypothetical protein
MTEQPDPKTKRSEPQQTSEQGHNTGRFGNTARIR